MLTKTKFKPIAVLACMIVVLLALFCIGNGEAEAATYSGNCGGEGDGTNLQWSLDTETGVLNITGSGDMTDYSATSSKRAPWYSYRSSITTVKIGNGVTSIGNYAFDSCNKLTNVKIGDSVTLIGYAAFKDCGKLTSIVIPDNVTSLSYSSFNGTGYYNNSDNWENDVLYIGKYLIRAKDSISGSYTIREGTEIIVDGAFMYCDHLTDVVIPDSVTSIGSDVFLECTRLKSVIIGKGVTSISEGAFLMCYYLSSIIVEEANIAYKSIDGNLYSKDGKILVQYAISRGGASFDIPNGVTSIGRFAFRDCTNLWSVVIPDSVTSIGASAFANCKNLSNIVISDSVTSIGVGAFSKSGYYNNSSNWENNVLYLEAYLIDEKIEVSGSYTIKVGTKCIADSVFTNNTYLTGVVIPNSVISIGEYTFNNCDNLTSVVIPDSVISIGEKAFGSCDNLTSVIFENTEWWWVSDSDGSRRLMRPVELADSFTAAKYLSSWYFDKYWFRTDTHTHTYTSVLTPPTATENGYTTYTCACGDSYIGDEVPALGNNDQDDDQNNEQGGNQDNTQDNTQNNNQNNNQNNTQNSTQNKPQSSKPSSSQSTSNNSSSSNKDDQSSSSVGIIIVAVLAVSVVGLIAFKKLKKKN